MQWSTANNLDVQSSPIMVFAQIVKRICNYSFSFFNLFITSTVYQLTTTDLGQPATKLKALYLRPVICSCRYSTTHEMNVGLYLPSSSTRSSTVYEYILISVRDPQVPWIYVLCCSGFTESAPQSTPNGTITGKAVQTIALAIFQPDGEFKFRRCLQLIQERVMHCQESFL